MSGIQNVSVNAAQSYASLSASGQQQSLAPFSNLDLTEAQRTKLRSIFQAAKKDGESRSDVQSQVNSILTPAQQQTFASDVKSGPGHQQQGGDPNSSSNQNASTLPSSSSSTDSTIDTFQ
jgi:Spy/CpxP family protein refolding chaperone